MVGNENILRILKRFAETGNFPHAFIFHGVEEVGKKTAALEFAKMLNCEKGKGFACGQCVFCRQIQNSVFPDLHLIRPESKEIIIAQIRSLVWEMGLKPFSSDYKIAVIDLAHLMNSEAQNCLLKSLEEPKGQTLFILITEHPDRLLETIRSRSQKIRFEKVPAEELKKYFPEELPSYLAESGKPGKIIQWFKEKEKIDKERKGAFSDFKKMFSGGLGERFEISKKISSQEIQQITEELKAWLEFAHLAIQDNAERRDWRRLEKASRAAGQIQEILVRLSMSGANTRMALDYLILQTY